MCGLHGNRKILYIQTLQLCFNDDDDDDDDLERLRMGKEILQLQMIIELFSHLILI
jgi:hypothetical protein